MNMHRAPVRWPQGDLAWLIAIGNVAADAVPLPAAGAGGLVESGQMSLLGGSLVNAGTAAATVTIYDGQSNNSAFLCQVTVPAAGNANLSLPRAGIMCEIGLFTVVSGGSVTGSLYVQHYWKYPFTPPGE